LWAINHDPDASSSSPTLWLRPLQEATRYSSRFIFLQSSDADKELYTTLLATDNVEKWYDFSQH
jgi:hypothetical protein